MPASNAASVQARVCSKPTPPAKVSHEPSEISETSSSEEPSLRYLMMLLAAGARPAGGPGCRPCRPWGTYRSGQHWRHRRHHRKVHGPNIRQSGEREVVPGLVEVRWRSPAGDLPAG